MISCDSYDLYIYIVKLRVSCSYCVIRYIVADTDGTIVENFLFSDSLFDRRFSYCPPAASHTLTAL